DRPEMIHPTSDCLVRNCNSALREQILDVTKAEREPEIEPDRLVNDLRREPISGVADFRHALRLPSGRRRDNALPRAVSRKLRSDGPCRRSAGGLARGVARQPELFARASPRGAALL